MTLLTIVQNAATLCGLLKPTAAFSSTDPNIQQLIAFTQDGGTDLVERGNWRTLKIPGTCIGDGVSTLFAIPPEFKRVAPSLRPPQSPLVSSAWPWSPLYGPINDEILNQMKATGVSVQPSVWQLGNGVIEFYPALAAAETITFSFFTKWWVQQSDGIHRSPVWTGDNDTALVPEDVIQKYAVWRWKHAKGLDYAEEFRMYETSLDRNAAQDGTERVVGMSRQGATLPDTFYGGTLTYPTYDGGS